MASERAVVGLGNPYRRDDGVGPALIDRLAAQDLPSTDLLDLGDAGFELVHVLTDYEAVVIVDAVRFGGDPGEYIVFDPDETTTLGENGATHDADPEAFLDIADRIGDAPASVRLFGIQPATTEFGERFSPAVSGALPAATAALLRVLRRL
ncbi:hydrogenase maturation protease [Halorhabdus sp. CBA1104]|uniref:hydrogenase maturation protease n=1 Tax=Halorhabdus sp. CBA1104 TaxID=1380432 RepID=UPI0018A6BF6A|nr:hydrogenase maturation protease [Halorhabdus sp. CBA1104]